MKKIKRFLMRLSCLDFKVFDRLGKYPLGCVIFGHSMYTRTSDISKGAFCNRYGCGHKEPAIKWGRPPQMPKCKPPRNDNDNVFPTDQSKVYGKVNLR